MIKYFTFSLSVTFLSWIVGMIINAFLVKTEFYKTSLSNLNFIKSKFLNKAIGISIIKWIVKNTFFKYFNPKLTIKNINEVNTLRQEMTIAEISHLIAFLAVSIFAATKIFNQQYLLAFIMMIINTIMNLYPSLLQQENKRRLDKLRLRFLSYSSSEYAVKSEQDLIK